jgi:uncharacterized phage protein (TIGR02216 family)
MEIGLGHMRLSPRDFWRYSLREWLAAIAGYGQKMSGGEETVEPFTSDDLARLMEEYPDDDRHPT